jgi:hypothetical protein
MTALARRATAEGMMGIKSWRKSGLAGLAAGALVVLGCAAVALEPDDAAELARPADIDTWPNIGATIRMSASPHMSATAAPAASASTPGQLRQVQMAPDAYAAFLRTREFPDGAAFAATIYLLEHDGSFTPEIYGPSREAAFVMEVIDRGHPDGRRFYAFARGAPSAAALPPGNECAVCHKAQGTLDGTFAQFYPALSRGAEAPAQ